MHIENYTFKYSSININLTDLLFISLPPYLRYFFNNQLIVLIQVIDKLLYLGALSSILVHNKCITILLVTLKC